MQASVPWKNHIFFDLQKHYMLFSKKSIKRPIIIFYIYCNNCLINIIPFEFISIICSSIDNFLRFMFYPLYTSIHLIYLFISNLFSSEYLLRSCVTCNILSYSVFDNRRTSVGLFVIRHTFDFDLLNSL